MSRGHDNFPATRNSRENLQESTPQWSGDIVQYKDGWCVLAWNIPGETLDTTFGSSHKWLRGLGQMNSMAAIHTESGNTYTLAGDLVIDGRTGNVYAPDTHITSITIGAQAEIPGVAKTSDVVGVSVAYKLMAKSDAYPQINQPSPFQDLATQVSRLHDQIEAQQALR